MINKKKTMQDWRRKNPWRRAYDGAIRRCKHSPAYSRKGICMFLTLQDIKYLWIRDKASLMKQPSIDRIDNNGDYSLSNCRFIEMSKNRISKPVVMFRVFNSATEAAKVTNSTLQNLCKVTNHRGISHNGYYWIKWDEFWPYIKNKKQAQAIISKIQKGNK